LSDTEQESSMARALSRLPWLCCLAFALACGSKATHSGKSALDDTCGGCPTNYTCGTANSIPVCFSPTGVPLFSNVFIIMMENTTLSTLQGAGDTPFISSLQNGWATSSNYHGVTHPSLRNYIALTSGDVQGIGCDCHPTGNKCSALNCERLVGLGSCGCAVDAHSIADDIEAAGLTWKDYGEDMGTACNVTDSGNYVARHNPFLYYNDVLTTARCANSVVDYASNFANDLANGPPTFSLIAPNLVDDMHNPFPASSGNYANGDNWLSQQIPAILGSKAFAGNGVSAGIVFIVFDEDDLSGGLLQNTDNPIPFYFSTPLIPQGQPTSSSTHHDHYDLLATIEDGLNLPRIGNAVGAATLSEFFVNGGPPGGNATPQTIVQNPCSADSDCNQGQGGTQLVCSSGSCVTGCNQASDCPADQSCDQSTSPGSCTAQCQSGNCSCTSDEQCDNGATQSGVVCSNGACVSGCDGAGDCDQNHACDQTTTPGTCSQPCASGQCACATDSQCNGGQNFTGTICGGSSLCIQGCNGADDCPSTQACDQSTTPGTCSQPCASGQCACAADAQCNGGQPNTGVICGPNGSCLQGCNADADCPTGQTCDLSSSPGTCG
jgi:hypothetical protein